MLKIKDNVDLKELEKFGYEIETDEDTEEYYAKYCDDNESKIFIFLDREIKQGKFQLIFGFKEVEVEDKWIDDLIKADLVEKFRR